MGSLPLPFKCRHDSCKKGNPPCFSNMSSLVKHLKNVHIDLNRESVFCPYEGCDKHFTSTTSLSQHLSKSHANWRSVRPGDIVESVPNLNEDAEALDETDQPSTTSASNSTSEQQDVTNLVATDIAIFYLQLESESLVPASTIQKIFDGIEYFSDLSHAAISNVLKQELKGHIPDADLDALLLRVRTNDPVFGAHHKHCHGHSLSTNHLRKKYYQKFFQYQEPEEYIVGPDRTLIERTVAFVSIRKNLENMLEDKTVQKQVDASFTEDIPETRSHRTVIKNYTDGSIYIKRAKDYGQKRLCIVLFVDAFDPTSNTSRCDNRYNTTGMYMSLLNLKPSSRSKLSSVKLVMLAFSKVFKDFRKDCLSLVFDELKALLGNGIPYKGETIPVTLEKIAGDNLGQHMLAGFLECFNPNVEFPCRYCDISNKVYIKQPWVLGEKRTPETYNSCARELKTMIDTLTVTGKLKKDKVYIVKGIKYDSELNDVPLFHVCHPHLSPCIGHDGFGGTWEYDMSKMIQYFVNTKNWMTYKLLNDRIKIFKFSGSDTSNVPAAVSESRDKLGGNEVQNWTLIRLFVFLVGDLILDTTDPVWQLYLQLKHFIEYVCAPQLTLEQISQMKFLSVQYLRARCDENLPDSIKLKTSAKTHYTAHFADLYELEGPLCQAWTLRFESKHAILGRVVNMSRTHVNIIATMAKKEQLYSSYLLTQESFPEGPYNKKKAIPMVMEKYPTDYQSTLQGRVFTVNAVDVQAVTIDNQDFRKGDYLILKKEKDTITLGKIKLIICDEKDSFFLLKKYLSHPLQDYGIYHVSCEQSLGFKLLHYSSAADCTLQAIYMFNEKQCFSLKHAILEESELDQEDW